MTDETSLPTMPQLGGDGELPRGATLGRYVILKALGGGGMGVVYLAFDNELERRVAVKVLRPEATGDVSIGEARARLVREAQALAKVSHPNVVAVWDVGTFGDEVFIAMEFVPGGTLRAWKEREKPGAKEVLAAYVQAGRGLEAAHAEGILHRDFKPENVIIDERGRVKVVDFGLARLAGDRTAQGGKSAPPDPLDDTGIGKRPVLATPLTQAGEMLGTPLYMAPELFLGQPASAMSDQFSFCVALYEALHGERPFAGMNVADLLASIRTGRMKAPEGEVKVPALTRRALRRGLDGDPSKRFPSMAQLLAELERAMASPRRWIGAAAAFGCAIVAAMVFARPKPPRLCTGAEQSIASAWSAEQADAVSRAFTATGSPRAATSFARVKKILDDYAASWVATQTEACEATRVRGVQSEEALDLRTGCLAQRAKELRATATLFTHADVKMVDVAVDAASRLTPVDACADVAALRAPFAPPKDEAQKRAVDALRARIADVDTLVRAIRPGDALPLVGPLVEDAKAASYAPTRAEALFLKGKVESRLGKPVAAETLFDAALEAEATKLDELAARAWTERGYADGNNQSLWAEAARDAREADAAIRRANDDELLRSELYMTECAVAYERGRQTEMTALAEKGLAIRERLLGPNHPLTLTARQMLADGLWDQGKLAEAGPIYETIHRTRVTVLGDSHPATLRSLLDVAGVKMELGDYAEAIVRYERVLQDVGSLTSIRASELRMAYGEALVSAGRVAEGEAQVAIGIKGTADARGATSPFVGENEAELSRYLVQRGLDAEALAHVTRALALLPPSDENPERGIGEAYGVRALCEARRGAADKAIVDATAALTTKDKFMGERGDLIPLLARGEALVARGRAQEGLADLEKALALGEANPGDAAIRADVRFALARALRATGGDRERVTELAARAATDLAKAGMGDAAMVVRAWTTGG